MENKLTDAQRKRYVREWSANIASLETMLRCDDELVSAIMALALDTMEFAEKLSNDQPLEDRWIPQTEPS